MCRCGVIVWASNLPLASMGARHVLPRPTHDTPYCSLHTAGRDWFGREPCKTLRVGQAWQIVACWIGPPGAFSPRLGACCPPGGPARPCGPASRAIAGRGRSAAAIAPFWPSTYLFIAYERYIAQSKNTGCGPRLLWHDHHHERRKGHEGRATLYTQNERL